jgi:hypothetical protein
MNQDVPGPVVIHERFRGPDTSGNGGYTCGLIGREIGRPASVSLRVPPPLERPLELRRGDDGRLELCDGDVLVADGAPAELALEAPEPPSVAEAEAAVERFALWGEHPFPQCFVCGPDRSHPDGLRIFPGQVGDREVVAAPWTPHPGLAMDGRLPAEVVWAALDCPTSFGGELGRSPATSVLGRLTARLLRPLEVGRPYVVIGWPLEAEGRKWSGGSAIFSEAAGLCAFAQGLWIELKP